MIKTIPVEDLRVGMFVEDFNVSWLDHPFLSNRRRLRSPDEIRAVIDHGIKSVSIDTELGPDSPGAFSPEESPVGAPKKLLSEIEALPAPAQPTPRTPYEEELRRARTIHARAKRVVEELLNDARVGKSIDGEKAKAVVDDMVESIFRNPDALTSLSRLKSFDEYTFQHSVNVSVLCLALGRHLGILKGELKCLGVGALLHDVGKVLIPQEILNKPGRLTEEEFERVRTHPLHGAKLLMRCGELPKSCATVALNHHERFDGRGYPRGLSGLHIGKFGLISAIVDVYDAITSNRVYHRAISGHEAVKKIYEWGKTDFQPIYVQKFIQCLGIYPTGSVVRLDTGEVGVVSRQNPDHLLRPWIRIVRDGAGGPVTPPLEVDLSLPDPKRRGAYARSVEAPLDIEPERLDAGAVLGGEARAEEDQA
ncbi:MAG: HD-GYP domain-containing protein [Deltaproteobacteria bacterium]|nr:HD-GYP domain-containing protein [Deltaproteobacteria bacterium]